MPALCVLLLFAFAAVTLRAQTPLPSASSLVKGPALEAFQLNPMPGHADAVDFSLVAATGPGLTRAWRVTDDAGRYAARAFHGDYTAIVEAQGRRTERTFTVAPSPTPATTEITVRF